MKPATETVSVAVWGGWAGLGGDQMFISLSVRQWKPILEIWYEDWGGREAQARPPHGHLAAAVVSTRAAEEKTFKKLTLESRYIRFKVLVFGVIEVS